MAPLSLHFFLVVRPTVLANMNIVTFLWIACLKGEFTSSWSAWGCVSWRILMRWGDTGTSCSSSLLLAPAMKRVGVFSSRRTCFAWGNSASSKLTRFAMSAYQRKLYMSDFTWLQGKSCNVRINVWFPNMEAISTRVLYLHCTHMHTPVACSFPLRTPNDLHGCTVQLACVSWYLHTHLYNDYHHDCHCPQRAINNVFLSY